MRIQSKFTFLAGLGLAVACVSGTPGFATGTEPVKVYPYQASQNFCPAGLQPVSVDGSTSCGIPDQKITYQQAQSHGTRKSPTKARDCPIGAKGCD